MAVGAARVRRTQGFGAGGAPASKGAGALRAGASGPRAEVRGRATSGWFRVVRAPGRPGACCRGWKLARPARCPRKGCGAGEVPASEGPGWIGQPQSDKVAHFNNMFQGACTYLKLERPARFGEKSDAGTPYGGQTAGRWVPRPAAAPMPTIRPILKLCNGAVKRRKPGKLFGLRTWCGQTASRSNGGPRAAAAPAPGRRGSMCACLEGARPQSCPGPGQLQGPARRCVYM